MKLTQVLNVLRSLAPEHLAEPWDAVGLQVGFAEQQVRRALLCIDLTEPVLDEALKRQAGLVVAYHPPIFKPLAALTDAEPKQRTILRAAQAGVAIYSPHTALDAAEQGVNHWLAAGVGEGSIRPIRPTAAREATGRTYKLVTFVPEGAADGLRAALAAAGAGVIGHYTECSFNIRGEGTFRGDDTTNPTIGQPGSFERVAELRMEMVVPADRLSETLAVLRAEHPYEEPAFDVYPVHEPEGDAAATGQGRVVELDRPVRLSTLVGRLKRHLGVKHLEVTRAAGAMPVRRVALCAGAGGSLREAAGDVDVFITGEMRHHDVLAAMADGQVVVLAGHTQTERPYLPVYRDRIIAAGGSDVEWCVSEADVAPTTLR